MSKPLFIEADVDGDALWEKHLGQTKWADDNEPIALDEFPSRLAALRAELPPDATHVRISSNSGYEGDHWVSVTFGRMETPAEVARREKMEVARAANWQAEEIERLRKRLAELEKG